MNLNSIKFFVSNSSGLENAWKLIKNADVVLKEMESWRPTFPAIISFQILVGLPDKLWVTRQMPANG